MARRKSSTRRPTNAVPSQIARHLAEHGFRYESMGGNTSGFRRVDGDGTEYVVILADSQGHAPSKMTDAVDLFTAPRRAEMTERRYASVRELLHALEALDRPLQARASLMYSRAQAGGSVTTERGVSYTGLQLLSYVDVLDTGGAPVGGGLALQGIPEEGVGPLFVSSADFDQLADGRLHTVDGVFYPRARWAVPGEQDRAIVPSAAPQPDDPKHNGRGSQFKVIRTSPRYATSSKTFRGSLTDARSVAIAEVSTLGIDNHTGARATIYQRTREGFRPVEFVFVDEQGRISLAPTETKSNGARPLVHGIEYPDDWPSYGRLIVDEALVRLEAAMRDEWPDFDEELAQRVEICLDELDRAVSAERISLANTPQTWLDRYDRYREKVMEREVSELLTAAYEGRAPRL